MGHLVDRELARAIAVADRDDPYWRMNDLLAHRAAVPEAENAAIVVSNAAKLLPRGQTFTAANWKKNRDGLKATPANVRLDDKLVESLHGELNECHEALLVARTLAGYTRGRYELQVTPNIIDTPLPQGVRINEIAWLLTADSAMRAHEHDLEGSLDSCRAIFGASRSLGDEPFAISQLVRVSKGIEALAAIRRVAAQGEPSDRALARIQELLLDEMDQPLMLFGLKGERGTWVEIVRRIGAGEVTLGELSNDLSKFDPHARRDPVTPWSKLYFDHQQAVMLEWMNDAVFIERQPYAQRLRRWYKWEGRFHVKQYSIAFWTQLLPLKLFPAVYACFFGAIQFRADLGATAILVAAERDRRKTGKWPESIAAIDQSILANAPGDPYSGQPFHFERRAGELVIYSVGLNLKDEKGERDPKLHLKGGPDDVTALRMGCVSARPIFCRPRRDGLSTTWSARFSTPPPLRITAATLLLPMLAREDCAITPPSLRPIGQKRCNRCRVFVRLLAR